MEFFNSALFVFRSRGSAALVSLGDATDGSERPLQAATHARTERSSTRLGLLFYSDIRSIESGLAKNRIPDWYDATGPHKIIDSHPCGGGIVVTKMGGDVQRWMFTSMN